jgi:hypothetical protein
MENIKLYLNHILEEKYKYEHIYYSPNIFTINHINQNLKPGKRYLLIFEDDYVNSIQPTYVLDNSINLNILLLKNFENTEEFKKHLLHINKTYEFYQNKYSTFNKEIFIKHPCDNLFRRIYLASMLNVSNFYLNLKMNFFKIDEQYVYTKATNIDINKILLREIFELKSKGVEIINYTSVNYQKKQENLYEVQTNDVLLNKTNKFYSKAFTKFNNTFDLTTKIGEGNSHLEGEMILTDIKGYLKNTFINNLIPYSQELRLSRGICPLSQSNGFLEQSIFKFK